MNIFAYQLLIFLSITLTGRILGKEIAFGVIGWWSFWTLTEVHTPQLVFLQFAVIGISSLLAIK